jgi:hypothetical protein
MPAISPDGSNPAVPPLWELMPSSQCGPGEAIVLAAAGRKAALADLEGDGVAVLRERTGA